jgi:hypothetical protein
MAAALPARTYERTQTTPSLAHSPTNWQTTKTWSIIHTRPVDVEYCHRAMEVLNHPLEATHHGIPWRTDGTISLEHHTKRKQHKQQKTCTPGNNQ